MGLKSLFIMAPDIPVEHRAAGPFFLAKKGSESSVAGHIAIVAPVKYRVKENQRSPSGNRTTMFNCSRFTSRMTWDKAGISNSVEPLRTM